MVMVGNFIHLVIKQAGTRWTMQLFKTIILGTYANDTSLNHVPGRLAKTKITLTYSICDRSVRLGVVFHQTLFVIYEKKHTKKGVETEDAQSCWVLISALITENSGSSWRRRKKKSRRSSWIQASRDDILVDCYELKVAPSPIHMLRPWSRCDGIWRWGLWPWWWSPEGWISTFRKSGQLALSASEKLAVCKAEKGHLQKPVVLASWSQASSLQTGRSPLLSFVGRPVL